MGKINIVLENLNELNITLNEVVKKPRSCKKQSLGLNNLKLKFHFLNSKLSSSVFII